ncbi:hypothetical protein FGG08_005475 [Glutinoglossum americanum]|uniref:Glutaminase A n=1 Tax=Glutinoglossum americanum TaxID=1670608 RepID=A0A9P8I368_9PEZI|nr:hypothetical protein FGG08_005475 [Glutinoglossum americanum]
MLGYSSRSLTPAQSIHYWADLTTRFFRKGQTIVYGKSYVVSYPTYLGAHYDASTTNLTYLIPHPSSNSSQPVNSLRVILSFLSPITPTSTLRQSLPASYLNVEVEGDFDVDIYIDLNGLWATGDRGSKVYWEFAEPRSSRRHNGRRILKTWTVRKDVEQLFTEWNDRAEWGSMHFSGPPSVHHQSGTSAVLRQQFARNGTLLDNIDHSFRRVMDQEPVFAFSKSFQLSSKYTNNRSDSVVFTIAHTQDPVTQFASARGLTLMKPLWASWFRDLDSLLSFHYTDFQTASRLASNYSDQVTADGLQSGSTDYADIVSLAARQVMGATSFAGTPDEPILFLKEISSNGNMQTVDVIFPAFPFFLYTNPRWLAYLLEPLLEHQLSGQYPNQYSLHDLGSHFPNATGHPDGRDEYMPVEECGNMLIMGLALVNSLIYDTPAASGSLWASLGSGSGDDMKTNSAGIFPLRQEVREGIFGLDGQWGGSSCPEDGDGAKKAKRWVSKGYKIWKQWTRYLVEFSLIPATQLSTDDFAGWLANHTNLALKGIIGIKAMSELARVIGNYEDEKYYKNISSTYIEKWEEYAISRDGTHAKLAYTWYGSWTTIYNLFADSLLCFHISTDAMSPGRIRLSQEDQKPIDPVPGDGKKKTGFVSDRIYRIQSAWYHNVLQRYGLPLDSRHLYTKSDWEFFAAAVASERTRSEILTNVATWVNETTTDRPLTDLYDTEGTGGYPGITFFARPVVGGHFAFLALERACGGHATEGLEFLNQDKEEGPQDPSFRTEL